MRLVKTLALYTGLYTGLLAVADAETKNGTDLCPGYRAVNASENAFGVRADLILNGEACDAFATDVQHLVLEVVHETDDRLHVKIQDAANQVYQVPEAAFPRPGGRSRATESTLQFDYSMSPFFFTVTRRATGEVLFDTSAAPLIFESQFVRLRTRLPWKPNLYGLGEHADSFRLPTRNFTRTLWNRGSDGMRAERNLYGSHPFYMDHRGHATHGVFLLNSNGMDVKIDTTHAGAKQHLEYNTLGGVLDLWFLGGPGPADVARQYSHLVGRPAMPPFWALGFHQSRHGFRDVYQLAEVVARYEAERIPLEAIWSDTDYMDRHRVFSLDPVRYPLSKMQAFVRHLHARNQRYVAVVHPAVAFANYPPLHHGIHDDVFLRRPNGSLFVADTWAGPAVFPDWFSTNIQAYYNKMFGHVFAPDSGIAMDGISLDANEPSFHSCKYPCIQKWRSLYRKPSRSRKPPRKGLEGWPCELQRHGHCKAKDGSLLTTTTTLNSSSSSLHAHLPPAQHPNSSSSSSLHLHQPLSPFHDPLPWHGLNDRCLTTPDYKIKNQPSQRRNSKTDPLSAKTIDTDVRHQNGLAMYDTHNLYGTMMASVVRHAILSVRPGHRPFLISRSTFAGAGAKAGCALGDNLSSSDHYRLSVRHLLSFASIFQFSMVGSNVCGYTGLSEWGLCARWVSLAAFYPLFRSHSAMHDIHRELYYLPTTKAAARKYVRIRYRLLDYLYTALWRASFDGTPPVSPLWWNQPLDENLWAEELAFNFGPSILVVPMPSKRFRTCRTYLPTDRFYVWDDHKPIDGDQRVHSFSGPVFPSQPVLIRGASIIPTRETWALTTTELRTKGFELLVALDSTASFAHGQLYLDDGISSNTSNRHSLIHFAYHSQNSSLSITGIFNAPVTDYITKITVLGAGCSNKNIMRLSRVRHRVRTTKHSRTFHVHVPLNAPNTVKIPAHQLKCFGDTLLP
ncbi:hypothetical protein CDD82_6371 [Ophiocordyceps australis]|uniref:Alpha-glucosidase n=1 Tax=Ophiocordyceps australis TaxID=1399860 RepID=A0A2C5YQ94_9HYPO|nr:hypothetical protein CDD82_6371 [Ophiocordyceps australis]